MRVDAEAELLVLEPRAISKVADGGDDLGASRWA